MIGGSKGTTYSTTWLLITYLLDLLGDRRLEGHDLLLATYYLLLTTCYSLLATNTGYLLLLTSSGSSVVCGSKGTASKGRVLPHAQPLPEGMHGRLKRRSNLQPYATAAATVGNGGCNRR